MSSMKKRKREIRRINDIEKKKRINTYRKIHMHLKRGQGRWKNTCAWEEEANIMFV